MPEFGYSYNLASNFPNGIDVDNLAIEIENSSITETLSYITVVGSGNVVRIFFLGALTGPEKTTLDTVVDNHNPNAEYDDPEEIPCISTEKIIASGPSGVSVEQFNFLENNLSLIGQTGTISGAVRINGIRHYGALSSDPSDPSPQAGDQYYNTAINHEMRYDGDRGKWLSIATLIDGAGRNGNTTSGTFYRRWNGMVLSATTGPLVAKGTIVRIGYTTSTAVTHTYQVLVNGSVVASLASGGAASAFNNDVDADFDEGNMSSRNASGSATTTNFQSVIYYKLRA